MNRQEMIRQLDTAYLDFIRFTDALPEADFVSGPPEKWSAGQQLDHLVRAVKPLSQGLRLPKIMFRLFFGKPNRPGRSYDQLVMKYQQKLQAGGRASGPFIPPSVSYTQKPVLIKKLSTHIRTLQKLLSRFSEEDLDRYLLPHPLLGKLTIREMMYFTIYHAEHHQQNIRNYLEKNTR